MRKVLILGSVIILSLSLSAFGGWIIGIGGAFQNINIRFGGAKHEDFTFYDDFDDGYTINFDKINAFNSQKHILAILEYGYKWNDWSIVFYNASNEMNGSAYGEMCIGWGRSLEIGLDIKHFDIEVSNVEDLPISSYGFSYAIVNGHIFNASDTIIERKSKYEASYLGLYIKYALKPFWIKLSYTPVEYESYTSQGIFLEDDEETIYFIGSKNDISSIKANLSSWIISTGIEWEF